MVSKIQSPVPVLNVMTIPPGATNTQARIVIDGVRGAIFEYTAGPSLGNLASSWAQSAGTDPYGNVYPAGFSAGSGSVFAGTDFVINSDGAFFYDGAPALGNLMLAITNPMASGTDTYGNIYAPGGISVISLADLTNVFSLQDTSGNTLMSMDNSGNITGQTISANDDIILDGVSLTGTLNGLASGLTNYGYIPTPFPSSGTFGTTETALFELDQVMTGGRIYEFVLNPTVVSGNTSGAVIRLRLRFTTDGSTPSTSSTLATEYAGSMPGASAALPAGLSCPFFPDSDATYRFLVTGQVNSGTWSFPSGNDPYIRCVINDLGANDSGQSANNITVLGTGTGGGNSKQTYTTTYNAQHTYSYQGSTGHQPNEIIATDGYAQQGGDYADTYNGDSYSWILWPYSTIKSDLSGATVNWVKLKLANQHTWYNSGGTLQVGTDTRTSFPSTTPQPSSLTHQVNQHFNEGQTLTFVVDSDGSTWGADFQSGGATTTLMAANTTDLLYYMYFTGATNPQLIINYTK